MACNTESGDSASRNGNCFLGFEIESFGCCSGANIERAKLQQGNAVASGELLSDACKNLCDGTAVVGLGASVLLGQVGDKVSSMESHKTTVASCVRVVKGEIGR